MISSCSFVTRIESRTDLILVENGIAHSGHEHHRDQEGNEGIVCHLFPLELVDRSYSQVPKRSEDEVTKGQVAK